jgi:alkanesulfonate monooxygenase SsuD/methylene tetrahydromethanopterin reductase-like flavin-dependent oxidoreductase (luciferase family)
MPPGFNHPARSAERVASLDLVSNGRLEWGTGQASSLLELGGYGVEVAEKAEAWREAVEQSTRMLAMDPYPGYEGKYFSMPCRNIVPKPVQRPHPPLWVACSNRDTIRQAARLGIGALTFAFVHPGEAKEWVDEYYRIFKEECVPLGQAVNPNFCMVSSFGVHEDAAVARERFREGFRFFQFAVGWHYGFGDHRPGRTSLWERFQTALPHMPADAPSEGGISDPAGLRDHLRLFQEAGVDQVAFVQQAGRTKHEHIAEAIELFATQVMVEFQAGEADRQARKAAELAPYIEAAFRRKEALAQLADDQVEPVMALGRQIAEKPRPDGQPKRIGWRDALAMGDAERGKGR